MAVDRNLAERVREALVDQRSVREVRMFGGLSFMVNGKLALSAGSHGNLLVRCDPDRVVDLIEKPGAEWAEMRGRRMGRGWIRVSAVGIETDEELLAWIHAAMDYSGEIRETRDS